VRAEGLEEGEKTQDGVGNPARVDAGAFIRVGADGHGDPLPEGGDGQGGAFGDGDLERVSPEFQVGVLRGERGAWGRRSGLDVGVPRGAPGDGLGGGGEVGVPQGFS
jgi:hypothetical protein